MNHLLFPLTIIAGWGLVISAGIDRRAEGSELPEPTPAVESLVVEPSTIVLHSANRHQQVIVAAVDRVGRTVDATREAEYALEDPAIASVLQTRVHGLKDGSTSLLVRFGGREVRVAVRVSGANETRLVHFANDIVPILSKLGCNSGGCHGKASGQNGFKLSVFGFDPEADHAAILKEARGRRVVPSSPERSLMLLKPTAQVPHGGGRRMSVDSPDHQLMLEWVRKGRHSDVTMRRRSSLCEPVLLSA